jgi:hypothetical protein
MRMSTPIKRAEIARHWGVSPAYVTITLKRHGAQDLEFDTLEAADRWRAVHAPPNPKRASDRALFAGEHDQSSSKNQAETAEKNRGLPGTTARAPKAQGGAGENNTGSGGARDTVDVSSFVTRDGDFDAVMLRQAEEVPQIAYGLYRRACERGDSVEIANATRNWNDAAKASAGVRKEYLEIQEKTRALIPLDLVMDIVGTELQPLRVLMLKGGERFGPRANPADPVLAQNIINEFIDGVFKGCELAVARVARELQQEPPAA